MTHTPHKTKSREQLEKSWARKNNALAVKEGVEATAAIASVAILAVASYPALKTIVDDARATIKLKRSRSKERRETKVHNITTI